MKALQFPPKISIKSNVFLVLATVGLLILTSSTSTAQKWLWGEMGSDMKANDFGTPIATDKLGNAYITGQYRTSINFGSYNLTTPSQDVMYLVKYNSVGVVQWAIEPISDPNAWSYGLSLASDPSGNVFVTGEFYSGYLVFGADTLKADNGTDVFLVKYDPNGNVLWARQANDNNTGMFSTFSYSVASDYLGNAYITGYFQDSIYFGSYGLGTNSSESVFLAKYNPAGNVLWAKQSAGPGTALCQSVSVRTGFEYITGYLDQSDTVYFGANRLVPSPNTYNVFLVKYDTMGNVKWAKQSIGSVNASSQYDEGLAVTSDKTDNAYITGVFVDSIKFGSKILTSPYGVGDSSAFLVKYSSAGNVLWAKKSTVGSWEGYSLASDNANPPHIYITGLGLKDSMQWGSNIYSTTDSTYTPDYTSFIMKLDTNGEAVCGSIHANGAGQSYYVYSTEVASDSTGTYTYEAGMFNDDTLICGPDTLTAAGEAVYVARWNACNVNEGLNEITKPRDRVNIYPNPTTGDMNVKLSGNGYASLKLYDVFGREVYTRLLDSKQSDLLLEINAGNLSNGVYFMQLVNEGGNISKRVVIEK